jgi:hypothetical protein
MANFRIKITNPGPKFKAQMEDYAAHLTRTIPVFMNMLASMIKEKVGANIANAPGHFASWTDSLKVNVEGATPNMRLYMTMPDKPYASIFETGGEIHGSPMLWIPLDSSDAGVRAKTFPGGLFSNRKNSSPRLLFSVTDRQPKFVGLSSVTIPKKFDLAGTMRSTVMDNYQSAFSDAWKASK